MVRALRDGWPQVWVSVSVTTRRPRPGEVDGEDYRFVDEATFEEMAADGRLLEHARYAGHGYGTPAGPLAERRARGVPCLLEIELHGARQVAEADVGAVLVQLHPPSWSELERRLRGRGTEDPDVVARRLARAREELDAAEEFDALLVNDDVDACAAGLAAVMGLPGRPADGRGGDRRGDA